MFASDMRAVENSAARLIGPRDGELLELIGDVIRVVLSEQATDGAFSLCEIHALPGGGPPPHTHPQLELMYVLEGEAEFFGMQDGVWQSFHAGPGCAFVATAGVPHTFAGRGETPARFLVLVADGSLERFFRQAGTPVASLDGIAAVSAEPDPAQLAQVMGAMQAHRIAKFDPAAGWDGDSVEFFPADRSGWISMLNEAIFRLSLGSRHNGLFAAEVIQRPGPGAPLHSHGAAELIHVVDGDVSFSTVRDGEITEISGRGGDTLFVPGNVPHCFRCSGDKTARLLAFMLPDGPAGLEGFLSEVARPLADPAAYAKESFAVAEPGQPEAFAAAMERFGMPLWRG